MSRLARDGTAANEDRKELIFPVHLTTSKIGNLTGSILPLAVCEDHTYVMTILHSITTHNNCPHLVLQIILNEAVFLVFLCIYQ